MRYLLLLMVLLTVCRSAAAEIIVVSFGTLESCEHCRVLEDSWSDPRVGQAMRALKQRRAYTDVDRANPALLRKWQVTEWPVTILAEVDENNNLVREYRRKSGSMSAGQLLRFINPTE